MPPVSWPTASIFWDWRSACILDQQFLEARSATVILQAGVEFAQGVFSAPAFGRQAGVPVYGDAGFRRQALQPSLGAPREDPDAGMAEEQAAHVTSPVRDITRTAR